MQPPRRTLPPDLSWAALCIALLGLLVWLLAAAPSGSAAPVASSPTADYASVLGRVSAQLRPALAPGFGPNVRANSDSTNYGQHEPSLAVSRTDPNTVVVASKDYRWLDIKHVWIDVSNDGGATWPVERQVQMPGIPSDLNTESDPVAFARDDGRIYVGCLGLQDPRGGSGGIFLTWSDDDGATWHSPSVAVYSDNRLDDKPWFAVDNSRTSPYYHRVYVTYAPGGDTVVEQHSADGGLTWSERQTIGGENTEFSYVVVGSDGTVYAFMVSNWGPGQAGNLLLRKSSDGGESWSDPITVAQIYQPGSPIRTGDQFRFFAIPSAAIDPNTGDLYVAWTDRRDIGTNGTDVLFVKGTNGGTVWTQPRRLSHDVPGQVRDHITPVLKVSDDGRLHAFWLDRRLDPNNHRFDSWYSSSGDGGATWDPDTRVSTLSQDMNVGMPPGSGNAAGDYWGLDVVDNTVYVAWNDTRSGDQDIYLSRGKYVAGPSPSPTATAGPATCDVQFADVPPDSTFYASVKCLACRNVVSGYPCGTSPSEPCDGSNSPYFRPGYSITRGQISKIVAEAAGFEEDSGAQVFEDVPPGSPFYTWVNRLAQRGIMSGYACGGAGEPCVGAGQRPYFRPGNAATRGQITKIVANASYDLDPVPDGTQTYADVAPNAPFYVYIERLSARHVIGGYACGGAGEPCDSEGRAYFRAGWQVSRGQAAKIVSNTFMPACSLP